ncbi:hypothetical protein L202_04617 [Cryptococcus amylolentus CBS 6039]|uniref:Uncharacterized protein n=1 Tax=Cryptococcus amylolentus CBS 6039 TaxID=1295533 RepID=A0A1E3HM60_9TREE|nr:hypothetical protein L202_04617 [Cryptococcus amylolentus CBS 6039]ODN77439.1 hypothetical protein L202_04617 [Cryptococcus amylolentus CBS 6039]
MPAKAAIESRPPIVLTSLDALAPVHYQIIGHLLDTRPLTYMRLSKTHRDHALRRLSEPVIIDSALQKRFRETIDARRKKPINPTLLISIAFSHSISFDSLETFSLLATDLSHLERAKRYRKEPGSPYPSLPARLFEHARRIQFSVEPFFEASSVVFRFRGRKCRGGRASAIGPHLGASFGQVVFLVDQPLIDTTAMRLNPIPHYTSVQL